MVKRPISVTIISWLVISLGAIEASLAIIVISAILGEIDVNHSAGLIADISYMVVDSVFSLFVGVFMLKGKNWSRICVMLIAFCHIWTFYVVHGLVLLISGIFLFLPKANAYFARRPK